MEEAKNRVNKWEDETQTLNLSNLGLTYLPDLPEKLTKLDCSHNQLKEFNIPLPESLTYLNCSYNQLEEISSLPETLTYLNCRYNELQQLPFIPLSCVYLDCSYNRLDDIQGLPDSLEYLNFFENDMPNEPTNYMLSLPNIKRINGGNVKYNSQVVRKLPRYDTVPPKAKLGVCLEDDKPYRIEYYLSKNKDNVVTGLNEFFNCCKRSKLGEGKEAVRYLGVDYYYIPCVERWINKLDLLYIRNTRFCIYQFIDQDFEIDGVIASIVIPYTLKEYEETN